MCISCYGQSTDTSSMEGMIHGNNLMICHAIPDISIFLCQFQCTFDRLRTAVGKEYPIHSGNLCNLLCRLDCRYIIIQIGSMDYFINLCF